MKKKIISYLTFRIGSEIFGANVKNIQNIIEYTELTKVPEMPDFIIGVSNLRGEVLPVVDSRIKMGITASEITSNTCIIVVELELDGIKTKAGFLVDEVSEVLEIEDKDINETPTIGSKYNTEIIKGVYPVGSKFIMLLDLAKVIYTEQLLNIQV